MRKLLVIACLHFLLACGGGASNDGVLSEPSPQPNPDTTAPSAPYLNLATTISGMLSVSGTAEAASRISVTFPDGTMQSSNALSDGSFGPITSTTIQQSGSVIATVSDAAGNVSIATTKAYEREILPALKDLAHNTEAKDIVRFLTQSTFGPTPEDIQALAIGKANYEAWIDYQFGKPVSQAQRKFEERLQEAGLPAMDRSNLDHAYQKDLIASDILWDTFTNGEDQLRQRVAFALSQIFVISKISDALLNNSRGIMAYHDLLAEHAFGNYRDLIESVTLNPLMGEYLSMLRNEKANQGENIRPDENYARELMQLFSIGLVKLNNDGSVQLDLNNQPIPTYDQDIVKAFARVFTGWRYENATFWNYDGWLYGNTISPMKAFESQHDDGEKILLNSQILPAGQNAYQNLRGALDNLFNHQNVAPFISKQLIQRLVTSNPSPDYIERISAVFIDNGEGERGDLAAVVKAILLDDEARNGHINQPTTFGKLKEPVLKFTSLMRAFDVTGMHPINAAGTLRPSLRFYWAAAASGQRPYSSPSVFNFFRPDHKPSGAIREAGLVAPEIQILNESYITEASNYGSAIVFNSYDFLLSGCTANRGYLDGFGCPVPDFTEELALAENVPALLDRLNLLMLAGDMSPITREALTELAALQTEGRFTVAELVHLIYISPEFAVQR